MKKNYIGIVYVLIGAALINLIAMLCVIPALPESIPVHFNYRFEVDRMGSPWFVIVLPAVTLVFTIAMAAEQKFRGRDYANNKPLTIFAVAFVAFFTVVGWVLYAMSSTGAQLGDTTSIPMDLIMGLGFAVLFVVMGNYLPTVKPNRTFGIRVPVTFRNEAVWKKTHRFAGRAYVLGGLFTGAMALIGHFIDVSWLILVGLLLGVIGSSIVVFIYAKRIEKQLEANQE